MSRLLLSTVSRMQVRVAAASRELAQAHSLIASLPNSTFGVTVLYVHSPQKLGIPQKLANAQNQELFYSESWLLNKYQHNTASQVPGTS